MMKNNSPTASHPKDPTDRTSLDKPNTPIKFYAHSLEGRPPEEWQPLEGHLKTWRRGQARLAIDKFGGMNHNFFNNTRQASPLDAQLGGFFYPNIQRRYNRPVLNIEAIRAVITPAIFHRRVDLPAVQDFGRQVTRRRCSGFDAQKAASILFLRRVDHRIDQIRRV